MEQRGTVALLWCENPPVNAINRSIRAGLVAGMKRLAADDGLHAAIIICKGKGFFPGADIGEFALDAAGTSWSDMDRSIDLSPKPVIAAIHGKCLGGGFEVALACHYRIADRNAAFGFPEVKLGLIPGCGGTQRLPRIAGFDIALDLITSGRMIGAAAAKELGLLHAVVDGNLEDAAVALAREVAGQPIPRARSRYDQIAKAREKPNLFADMRDTVRKRQRGVKAPLRAVGAVENALHMSFEEAMKSEAAIFDECQKSEEHRALSHLFFAEREARRVPGLPRNAAERAIHTVAVIGGGTMGRGIALAFAEAGIPVRVVERSDVAAQAARDGIRNDLERSVARSRMSEQEAAYRSGLIEIASTLDRAAAADLVIEAVFEDMDVKREVFRELDAIMPQGAILASNTSNLDLNQIARVTKRPGDVVGLHFFSPANVMKLVEIVRGDETSDDVLATALSLAKRMGKQPVVAGVCDGFIVNRAFSDYWRESRYLVEEGASPYEVDAALVEFGMPQGPFAVSDLVGLDVSRMIRANRRKFHGPEARRDTLEDELVDAGRLGRKNGSGWYSYVDSPRGSPDAAVLDHVERYRDAAGRQTRKITAGEIVQRCIYCVINEGAKELEEGIALRSSDIDVAAVMGYGFPAYRGGPMHYGETVGLDRVAKTIMHFHETVGPQWKPSSLLVELARSKRGFSSVER
jgi:3-hydroxyacyl-CoA dehydrogenase